MFTKDKDVSKRDRSLSLVPFMMATTELRSTTCLSGSGITLRAMPARASWVSVNAVGSSLRLQINVRM